MSLPEAPPPVKLIFSIITGDSSLTPTVLDMLRQKFGKTDFISSILDFNFTDYYEKEMGAGLVRQIVSFEKLVSPDELPRTKLYAVSLEADFMDNEKKRRVNIDPGYIALHHLILATCKSFSHRPYIKEGIYADLTLVFRGKTFAPLPWTFPDYGSEPIISILNNVRAIYYNQLKRAEE